ncbi:TetR/AcrR family transcriptional regulator [Scopulibacillus cellulosilyticus]|uniref:TetR/AcrR family transcriptional regulator n=1 Tax=Scopulibacillus cellulosilyticus TaxID=2665665 RepID=A0ABW2PTM8_9BACL
MFITSTIDEIRKVSLKLFASKGYEGTSLSEIASGVGIKKPSLYAHFKSKEDLFLSVFGDVLEDNVKSVKEFIEPYKKDSVEIKLREFLYGTCRYYFTHEDEVALLKRAMLFPPEGLKDKLQDQFLTFEKNTDILLKKFFTEGIEKGVIREEPIDRLLAAYYCLQDGLFIQMFYYSKAHFEEKMESVWHIFWKGIKAS